MKRYITLSKEKVNKFLRSYDNIDRILERKYRSLSREFSCSVDELQYFVSKLIILFDNYLFTEFKIGEGKRTTELFKLTRVELTRRFSFDGFTSQLLQDKKINKTIYTLYKYNREALAKINDIVAYEIINTGCNIIGPERAFTMCRIFPNTQPSIPMSYLSYTDVDSSENGIYDERFITALDLYKELPNSTLSVYWRPQYFNDNAKRELYTLREINDDIEEYKRSNQKVNRKK